MYRSLGTLGSLLRRMPWPDSFLPLSDLPADLLDRVLVMDFSIDARPEASTVWCTLALEGEFGISPPSFDLVKFVLGGESGGVMD